MILQNHRVKELSPTAKYLCDIYGGDSEFLYDLTRRHFDATPAQAWDDCRDPSWMLKLAMRAGVEDRQLVLAGCAIAEVVLPVFEAARPNDDRPRRALTTFRYWCEGRVANAALDAASQQAVEAGDAGCSAAAAYAAQAIAFAHRASTLFMPVTCAAKAHELASPGDETAKHLFSNIVRQYIPWKVIDKCLRKRA